MKVCYTCRHWLYKHKGVCVRLNQGVGKFWMCEHWLAAEPREEAQEPAPETAGAAG